MLTVWSAMKVPALALIEMIYRDGQTDRGPVPAELRLQEVHQDPRRDRTAAAVKRQTAVTARTIQA